MTRLYLDHPLIQVDTDEFGTPLRLRLDGTTHGEVGICNRWRVDDDWWRTPTARAYFKLVTHKPFDTCSHKKEREAEASPRGTSALYS